MNDRWGWADLNPKVGHPSRAAAVVILKSTRVSYIRA